MKKKYGIVISIIIIVLICCFIIYRGKRNNEYIGEKNQAVQEIGEFKKEIPDTLKNIEILQGTGMNLYDVEGDSINYSEILYRENMEFEGFLTLVNATEKIDSVRIIMVADEKQLMFSIDGGEERSYYEIKMEPYTIIHIPIKIDLSELNQSVKHKISILAEHYKDFIPSEKDRIMYYMLDYNFTVKTRSIERMVDYIDTLAKTDTVPVVDVMKTKVKNIMLIPDVIDRYDYQPYKITVSPGEKVQINVVAYDVEKQENMLFLVLDKEIVPYSEQQSGILWEQEEEYMLQSQYTVQAPAIPGIYIMYAIALSQEENSCLETYTSEKIVVEVKK